jgi:hypothetical protein
MGNFEFDFSGGRIFTKDRFAVLPPTPVKKRQQPSQQKQSQESIVMTENPFRLKNPESIIYSPSGGRLSDIRLPVNSEYACSSFMS